MKKNVLSLSIAAMIGGLGFAASAMPRARPTHWLNPETDCTISDAMKSDAELCDEPWAHLYSVPQFSSKEPQHDHR